MAGAEPDPEGGVSTLEERQACSANAPMLDGSEASFPVLSPEDNYYYGACWRFYLVVCCLLGFTPEEENKKKDDDDEEENLFWALTRW